MPHSVTDILHFAFDEDAVNLGQAVDDVLLQKIETALTAKRQEIAQNVFKTATESQ